MSNNQFVVEGVTPRNLHDHIGSIVNILTKYGLVVLPGFLSSDLVFLRYLNDVKWTLLQMCAKYEIVSDATEIGDVLSAIAAQRPEMGRVVADLGTQPNKFFSFNSIKFSAEFDLILRNYFGESGVVATPPSGDTLHFFPPGRQFHRYNLPAHQDYPYLMQSPRQLTFYLGISSYHENVGGLRVWPESHLMGLRMTTRSSEGGFTIIDDRDVQFRYDQFDINWSPGDLGIFDSLLCHASVPNQSMRHSRIVQIFRFSDLNHPTSKSYDFYSTSYSRRSIAFEEVHSEFFCEVHKQKSGAE